ncbi:HD domain-containing protein [Prauserella cavernicola]|uniref:HD domain-containing protein n=1 Tax=Prauserella cavernicola TaxID=2800127 RepID=A0A934V831_9PSEU|nr:HD domain-containing protein [Prauserella cavernicola]MBK1787318.1 HD domain-containing protein [Prauserella cavernicola]
MTSELLHRALTDDPALRPLPTRARRLLEELQAPPRLAAHLRAVHDVACQLADWLQRHCPGLELDREAVAFGAAVHDIGKVLYPSELSGPGSAHEEAGYELLLAHGVESELARFARTHAAWTADDVGTEDLVVSLADKVWKGKRVAELENLVTASLATAGGQQPWEVFLALDDILDRIAADADSRLAFQAGYPVAV